MSSLLYRLGLWIQRRAALVIALWLVFLALVGASAVLLKGKTDDAFTIPGSSSQVALDQLKHTFPATAGSSAQIVATAPDGQRIDTPEIKKTVAAIAKRLSDVPQVATVLSPFDGMLKGQVSDSGRATIITVPLEVSTLEVTDVTRADIRAVADDLRTQLPAGSQVYIGGAAFANVIPRLSLLEAVGLVIALMTLLALFRSLLASTLPLLTALIGVGVAIALIFTAAAVTTVSSTAPMLAIMLGLAVGIDYALLILSRHRDQLAAGDSVHQSAAKAVATAGSAVVFAGLTVIIALLGLAVVRIPFLTVMGLGAALAVLVAMAVALTLLPALMGLAGERLRPRARRTSKSERHHVFNDIAHWWVSRVTRHPWLFVAGVTLAVGAMALPGMPRLVLPDNGAAPKDAPARITYDVVGREFGPGYNGPLIVTADIVGSHDPLGVMKGLAKDIGAMDGVKLVALSTPNEKADTGIVQVIPSSGPHDEATVDLVDRIRAQRENFEITYGVKTAVTGFTAVAIDVSGQLQDSLLPFGIVVVGLCLVLLTIVFRSVAVPIKATVGYLFSLVAAFGMTGLVFGHGVGADLFRVQQVGGVISFLPVLLMGVLFGLAMDYEVFLVSRMSEEYVHTRDFHRSIVEGFTASAPVVTAAAIIMVSVFAAFVPAENANLKPIAFALAVGVFVDAFLVRMTLVPAVMQLLGDRAWWLPTWLQARLPHFDIEGEGVVHELALANWPAPGSTAVVAAQDVVVRGRSGSVAAQLPSLQVFPGQWVAIEADGTPGRALAYALTGRVAGIDGNLKVMGQVLPQRARDVRRRAAVIDLEASTAPLAEVDKAAADGVPLMVLCYPDALAAHADREWLATVLGHYLAYGGAVVAVCHHRQALLDLFPAGGQATDHPIAAPHPEPESGPVAPGRHEAPAALPAALPAQVQPNEHNERPVVEVTS